MDLFYFFISAKGLGLVRLAHANDENLHLQ